MELYKSKLVRIFYNITNRCNLYCHYCYAGSGHPVDQAQLSLDTIERIASDGRKCGASSVLLSGGEPFFRKDWFDVFSVFDDYGYDLSVSSNGTLINEKTIQKLTKFKNIIFQISLDASEQNFDKIVGVNGTFKRVTKAIDLLLANGYEIQVNSVLHKSNFQDIPFLIRYSYERELLLRFTLLSTDYGRAKGSPLSLDLSQIQKVIQAVHVSRKVNPYVELNIPPLLLHPDDLFHISPSCGWMHHQCGIQSNGDVTICGLSGGRPDLVAGNVKSQSLEYLWNNSPLFRKLRLLEITKIKEICGICPFLSVCGGSCRLTPYISTGDFYAPNGVCQMFYEALKRGDIEDFPSYVINLGFMECLSQN
ncbi:radical SAM domain protein [Methanosarcina barkeri str. Wiesmoor]|uniref:Radical SAM domain protein n=2 Tax=Methanosarcina barkeri TaxID=2208 RepID=A0A0E3QQQ6_METBA|nr:radical SAM protein [Methanosarcina barkeri]AKB52643.1 radical SAM domain protein [Methanosarcina barkeri str. Wiesmoor]